MTGKLYSINRHIARPGDMIVLALAIAIMGIVAVAPCGAAGAGKVVDVAVGQGLSVALTDDGTVWTWGNGWYGDLGNGSTASQASPQKVPISGVTDIAAGLAHVVALKSDGTVWTWGENNYGQLGDGTTDDSKVPVQVQGLSHVKAVAAGLFYSVALKDDGTVWTWGYDKYGQLGDGAPATYQTTPVRVSGLANVARIYAGYNHNFAVDGNGNLWAWGENDCGELGDGTNVSRSTPEPLPALAGLKDIAAGSSYTIALKSDGTVIAWGEDYAGWLGDGSSATHFAPLAVKGLSSVASIATGEGISFAARNDGTVSAWGMNSGGLIGNGLSDQAVSSAHTVGSLGGMAQIAVGAVHALAVKADGSLWAWGDDQFGEIGNGKFDQNTYTPTQVLIGGQTVATATPASTPVTDNASATAEPTTAASGGSQYVYIGAAALVLLALAVGVIFWVSRR